MNARLTTTMKVRPVVTGFGQIATQMKKSPRVASVGRAAARKDSSITPNMAAPRNQVPFGDRRPALFSARAEASLSGPKVTVPVLPIAQPAAPMSSMAIVT